MAETRSIEAHSHTQIHSGLKVLSFLTRKKKTSKNSFSKGHESTKTGQPEQIHTDTQPYLVSAIFVAITIFLTPGGGLLKTWVRGGDEIRYLILKKGIKTGSGNREKNSRALTCVWLTVGMRECKGMMTNRSKIQQDKETERRIIFVNIYVTSLDSQPTITY